MNIVINLDNLDLKDNIASLKIKLVNNKIINIYNILFNKSERNISINVGKEFKHLQKYILIISIVQNGKQVIKNYYSFSYENYDEYKLDNFVYLTNKKIITQNKKTMYDFDENNIFDLKFEINPLIMVRKEKEKTSIYNKGNIILLKNNMEKVFNLINNKDTKCIFDETDILLEEFVNILRKLVLKGFVVVYE